MVAEMKGIKMHNFSEEEVWTRSLQRIALVLHGYWEEGRGAHTRLFDTLIPDHLITIGESVNGKGHREHIVPCVYIRNLANQMFTDNLSVDDVSSMLERLLKIAHITKEEAKHLDHHCKLKTNMPEGWESMTGSVTARLTVAGIQLK